MTDTRPILAYRLSDGNVLCVPCAVQDPWRTVGSTPVREASDIGDGGYGEGGEDWRWEQCVACGWDAAQHTVDGPRPLERSGG